MENLCNFEDLVLPSDTFSHRHNHAAAGGCQADAHDHCQSDNHDNANYDVHVAAGSPDTAGRRFQVNGLDCVEEVAVLNRVVGPMVGGEQHLAFDVINGSMTVLDTADAVGDDRTSASRRTCFRYIRG